MSVIAGTTKHGPSYWSILCAYAGNGVCRSLTQILKIDNLNAENESLKKQMENKHETLKRDNVWLVNAVQGLKDETMELQRYKND